MVTKSNYLEESNIKESKNKVFTVNDDNKLISDENYDYHHFINASAKKVTFYKVSFKYTVFNNAYIRNCKFESCDFTGSKFINCNMRGSSFSGCEFQYAIFEKTFIDNDVLYTSAPYKENLKREFARTLRVNFQQIGDVSSVNKAIKLELQAAEVHLKKSWNSKEKYYRDKYQGIDRLKSFLGWTSFKFFDFLWGNGESVLKTLRSLLLILIIISFIDLLSESSNCNVWKSIRMSPQLFFGVHPPEYYSPMYITILTILRLIIFGMFMALIIKRLNRR